ncbi:SDR family NAD(P)-dependent oxidoreductase [Streptomyces sp. H10-C2]|uniref:SDR family NAD(P)-dependent oxidoreductase n=1 Tax=unclassified Streptomyces TaxID=2593676 RepID=UPI0024BAD992|nr:MULTISPECIES: SDR family NAD(P)-dependent oxidoreductase [unclassified Streptomyces]MDJ0347128.1 SDR family NAD(P)-dependent oxidoreductase [Streptomyces sp. PH10-H1]MDJ0375374.1 SDR family NAD(P)-dependent oxidoreductase [Streptomyces sp. H10-C2]
MNRTVLVTGATSGIGWETARQLADQGSSVILHAPTAAAGRQAIDRLTAAGSDPGQLCLVVADFTRLDEVGEMARKVADEHPRLDVLVNNAGIAAPERHTITADGNEISLQVNFLAADPRVTAVSVHPGVCDTALLPLYGQEGIPAAQGAAHVVRLCDPATEIVNGAYYDAYYDRDVRAVPAAVATEDRTVHRLNKLADLLVGHTA